MSARTGLQRKAVLARCRFGITRRRRCATRFESPESRWRCAPASDWPPHRTIRPATSNSSRAARRPPSKSPFRRHGCRRNHRAWKPTTPSPPCCSRSIPRPRTRSPSRCPAPRGRPCRRRSPPRTPPRTSCRSSRFSFRSPPSRRARSPRASPRRRSLRSDRFRSPSRKACRPAMMLQEFPADAAAAVPDLARYKYVKLPDRVLIVDPPLWTVVGEIKT